MDVVPGFSETGNSKNDNVDLSLVRKNIRKQCNSLLDKDGPYGSYRGGSGTHTSLHSSCDVAIMRTIMVEDLMVTLSDVQRQQWIDFINSFAISRGSDYGSYCDTYGHLFHHANGLVIGALGVMGGRQKDPDGGKKESFMLTGTSPWEEVSTSFPCTSI